jgi:hypothetical protein
MRCRLKVWELPGAAKPAMSCLLAVLVLLAAVLSSSPLLHEHLHHGTAAGHGCVICLFAHGQSNTPTVLVALVVFVAAFLFLQPPLNAAVLSSVDLRLAPGRAPPRF